MDRKFLEHYNTELRYLREMSGEFARQNPKIAKRLMLDEFDCKDPYVERLLEGFAYLAARVQYKIDSEFSSFSQSLVNSIFPQYHNPSPSCTIVQFSPDYKNSDLSKGPLVKNGTLLKSHPCGTDKQICKFRTTSDVRLYPINISSLKYNIGSIEKAPGKVSNIKASMELSLHTVNNFKLNEIDIDSLRFYIRVADKHVGMMLYENIFANCTGLIIQSKGGKKIFAQVDESSLNNHLKQVGFDEEEAIFPLDARTFEGHRLLREYYLFPQKFMFFELNSLKEMLKNCDDVEVSIVFLFNKSSALLKNIGKENLCLYCSPAVNLFKSSLSRVPINRKDSEFYIPADRVHPLDYEIIQIERVDGYNVDYTSRIDFLPFYSDSDFKSDMVGKKAFYNYKRVPRTISETEKEHGTRTSYIGTELYISITDTANPPYKTDLDEIGVTAWCSNRDLPMLIRVNEYDSDFKLEGNAPITSIKCVENPTPPKMPFELSQWCILNNIAVNFFSFVGEDSKVNIDILCEIQKMYAHSTIEHDIIANSLESVDIEPIVRRVGSDGPILFSRGFSIKILFNERAYSGSGIFLLGSILDRFFGASAPINSFTETQVFSNERGGIKKWPIRAGHKQLL